MNYRVKQPDWHNVMQLYHINLLMKRNAHEVLYSTSPTPSILVTLNDEVPLGVQLSSAQKQKLKELVSRNLLEQAGAHRAHSPLH